MWQRIQTLYLAISTILIAVMLFSVKAVSYGADGAQIEEYKYLTYIPFAILLIIILILNILALTTYKIRVFQYRTACSFGSGDFRTSDLDSHRVLRESPRSNRRSQNYLQGECSIPSRIHNSGLACSPRNPRRPASRGKHIPSPHRQEEPQTQKIRFIFPPVFSTDRAHSRRMS